MAQLSPELATELLIEKGGWFGSPALLTQSPALISQPDRATVIDGLTRIKALLSISSMAERWRSGGFEHYVFTSSAQRATTDNKLLPRMLALAGHYDRAYVNTPDHWRASTLDLEAYLRLPRSEAVLVFAHRHNMRKATVREAHRLDPRMGNRSLVRKLRQMVVTADELGQPLPSDEIRRVLFNDSAIDNGRPPNGTGSLYDEPDPVHGDTPND
jgi:hypothetical protein